MMSAYPHYTHAGTPMAQAYSPDWYIQQPSPQQSMYAHSQHQQTPQTNLYNDQSPAGIHYSNQASSSPGHMLHSPAPSTAPSVHTHSSPPYSVPSPNYASPPSSAPSIGYGQPSMYDMKMDIHPRGRKKALFIGINYFGQRGQLRGCINDVKNMSTYIVQQFGYRREDMVILTDDQQNTIGHPTKHNILRAMHWLVKDAEPNDSLFFHYSGHGGQTRDPEVEEHEGYDEVIYPVDFRANGHISDDEMHRIMVRPLKQGVRLTAIFDSCHSGTALELPYVYSTQGIMKVPGAAVEAGEQLLQCVSNRVSHPDDDESITSSVFGIVKRAAASGDNFRHAKISKSSMADVIMFSSSKDNQKSADISINAKPTGAMSWAFITALTKNPQQSYVQLLNNIRDELGSQYSQRPQLSSSHPLSKQTLIRL